MPRQMNSRPQQGLAHTGRALDQDQVALENPAQEDLVQVVNARLDQSPLSYDSIPFTPRKRESFLFWSDRSLPGSLRARSRRTAWLSARTMSRSKASRGVRSADAVTRIKRTPW